MDEPHWFKRVKIKSSLDKAIKSLYPKERMNYASAVIRMYNDYEEMVFNLAEQSANETIDSIKRMSVGQRMKFQELISKRNQRLKNMKHAR